MFRSSIEHGIQSIYKLESDLGVCSFYNLVFDLLQEAPHFFAARVKADSDSGVNWAEGEKGDMWRNPLQNVGCLLQLVELIPRQPKKLNEKKIAVWEPIAKFRLLSSVAPPLLGCLGSPRAALKKIELGGGTPCKILIVCFS